MAKKSTAAPAASTAVTPKKGTSVGQTLDYSADAGAGFENADKNSYAIPFLVVLQSGSPQCKKSDPAYIKGATEGNIYNTVTGEVYSGDDGVEIIPCGFTNTFIEWGLREKGGGFVAEYPNEAGRAMMPNTKMDDKSRAILPSGNALGDHRNHYVLMQDAEGIWSPALLSLTSTAIKASRNWMSGMQRLCSTQTMPMFALRYLLTSVPQTNEKGSWYGPSFEYQGPIEDVDTYQQAKAFYQQVKSGAVKTSPREDSNSGAPGHTDPDDM